MKKYGTVWKGRPHPACKAHEFLSRNYWKCVLPKQSSRDFQSESSSEYVVDAFVFLVAPNANINAAVMMIAEKASSDIKRDLADGPF
ncbi:Oxygen-dependent choline dehydrogenase [Orchesella cincta]|uniref:Oxygen-dependent choline dehydrogenase n=1 Tax=Orchesella cincta TaxID=48709 RepID=A0A1D2M6P3_ORCCI|nr:Oxygen-dependent choline dehydrogenase [Orchesella cincta]